jgi:ATP-dependent exoDNAse (exonuclease V) alpha subunit
VAVVPADRLDASLADRPTLTDEQRAMVISLATSGAGVETVVGRAGAGKTYALDAARAAWQAAGYQVVGAALAARAAAELQAGSGIPSTTVDRLLADLDQPGPLSALRRGSVVVIDEAAMVGTRKLARLAAHAERADAKLVLIGDHRQIPEIEAGGAFAALTGAVPVSELAGNRRQVEAWERQALAELRAGSVPTALDAYRAAGRVHLAPTADTARERMVDDWWHSHLSGERAAMYAVRRVDVEDLNQRARQRLDQAGRLGFERMEAAGREFAVGDEVLCLRNDRRLGVRNGTRSTVTDLDRESRTVTLAEGIVLPAEYLEAGHLGYSYCTTVHKAQGSTVDRAFLLGSDTLYREAGYVGLSRAREANHLYFVSGDPHVADEAARDPLAETIRHLSDSKAQTLALAQLEPRPTREAEERAPFLSAEKAAVLADPPQWAVEALGPPPVTEDDRRQWANHAERLNAYRDIYAITDQNDPLGPRPEEPTQRRAWDLAHLSILEHQRSLELDQGLHR